MKNPAAGRRRPLTSLVDVMIKKSTRIFGWFRFVFVFDYGLDTICSALAIFVHLFSFHPLLWVVWSVCMWLNLVAGIPDLTASAWCMCCTWRFIFVSRGLERYRLTRFIVLLRGTWTLSPFRLFASTSFLFFLLWFLLHMLDLLIFSGSEGRIESLWHKQSKYFTFVLLEMSYLGVWNRSELGKNYLPAG
jgi:hypothetical protein